MRVTKEDQNTLVLKHSNFLARSIGVLFSMFGVLIIINLPFLGDIPWWAGILFFMCGLPAILLPTKELIIFDKQKNQLIFNRKNLIKKYDSTYTLLDIKEVNIWIEANVNSGKGWQYLLGCTFNDGHRVILNESHPATGVQVSIGSMFWRLLPERKLAQHLAIFLNVPFVEKQPPTFSEALSQVSERMEEVLEKYKGEQNKKT